jgi:Domain of unknown function (DUF222)
MHTPAASLVDTVLGIIDTLAPVREVTDAAVRDEIAACERAAQMLIARQAELMTEMGRRAAVEDRREEQERGRRLAPHECRAEFVADELAVTLSITKMAAAARYETARGAARCPALMAAWAAGRIDQRKVDVVAEALRDVEPVFADALARSAVEYAGTHTAPQLRQWLARRVVAADPGAAEIRRARATAERRVTLTPRADGVSELWALLPSVQARQVYETANAVAQASGPDDVRTMDQRRADALVDLLVGRAEPPQVQIQVVVPADTLLGEGAEPGFIPGIGTVTAGEACELAGVGGPAGHDADQQQVTWRRLLTDPDSGVLLDVAERQYRPSRALDRAVRSRDVTCRFPGCRRAALTAGTGTDLDHTIPWPEGPTAAANLATLCRHHHRVKHSPGWSVEHRPDGVLEWTTPVGRRFTTEPWTYFEPLSEVVPMARCAVPPS